MLDQTKDRRKDLMPVVLAAIIAVAGSIGLLIMNATPPHDGRSDSIPTAIVAAKAGAQVFPTERELMVFP